uniref:Rubisco LSMT substrate-binding domain-containing protein n=1 Tax=Percolomonas cosmopolitus TaxID=63605 RepID=A0A7S1KKU6_9EUKA
MPKSHATRASSVSIRSKRSSTARQSSSSLWKCYPKIFKNLSPFTLLIYLLASLIFIFLFYIVLDEVLIHLQKVLFTETNDLLGEMTTVPLENVMANLPFHTTAEKAIDIEKLSGEISSSEASPGSSLQQTTRRRKSIRQFLKWMQEHGADVSKISLKEFPSMGLGVAARKDLSRGDVYMRIPKKLLVSVHGITHSATLSPIFASQQLQIKDIFIVFLLFEKFVKREDSFWHPYIDILPEHYDMSPFFWSVSNLEYLKGSNIYQRTIWERNFHRQRFNSLKERVFDRFPEYFANADISFEKFAWAEWTYSSRLFFIEGQNPREHLVPLAEMVNCFEPFPIDRSTQFVETTSDGSGDVVVKANHQFKRGQQIFESYGYKSNAELLRYEGFHFGDSNPNDCIWLDLPFYQHRANDIRQKMGLQGPPQYCFSPRDILSKDLWPQQAMSYLRLLVATAEENNRDFRTVVSRANEVRVYNTLLRVVRDMINANPYTEQSLLNTSLTPQARLAIEFRLFEKKQLQKIKSSIQMKERLYSK